MKGVLPPRLQGLAGHIKALYVRRALDGFFNGLTGQYDNVYIVALGFSEADVGRIRSFSLVAGAVPVALLSLMADVVSRRKAYLLILFIEALSSLLYYAGCSLYVLAAADVLLVSSLLALSAVEGIILADYVEGGGRGLAFGLANATGILASTAAPLVAAYIINSLGGIKAESIRFLYLLRFVGLSASLLLAYEFIRDAEPPSPLSPGEALREGVELLRLNPWLKRWLLFEVLGGYVWSMSAPFEMIFAVEARGADALVLGAMGMAMNIGAFLASPLIGRLSDEIGRVRTLLLLRPLYYASVALLVLAPKPQYLVLAWFLRGVVASGSAIFEVLALELVPRHHRGRWTAMKSLISMILRSPAPLIGGVLYTAVSPAAPFAVAVVVDALLRVPLLYETPETLDRPRYLATVRVLR